MNFYKSVWQKPTFKQFFSTLTHMDALADILHGQYVTGDATEWVGRDLSDVGMIGNFPAKEETE